MLDVARRLIVTVLKKEGFANYDVGGQAQAYAIDESPQLIFTNLLAGIHFLISVS